MPEERQNKNPRADDAYDARIVMRSGGVVIVVYGTRVLWSGDYIRTEGCE